MIVVVSWCLLLVGVALFAWFFAIRGRGSLNYWIRQFEVPEQWALGQTFQIGDKDGQQQFFTDANAAVRSLDRRTNKVIRQWNKEEGTLFLGLVMDSLPDDPVPEDYELRKMPKRQVVRLSGANRLEELNEVAAVKGFARDKGISLDWSQSVRLSGQSFGLFQWDVTGGGGEHENSLIGSWAETTYQLRNNLVLPLLATWLALALIGTAQPLLLVLGIILICFLSGACKFVFIHQMTDEADEIHLQNY